MVAGMSVRGSCKVQDLYDVCCMVFSASSCAGLDGIWWLRDLLRRMEAADVRIDASDEEEEDHSGHRMFPGQRVQGITYVHIHQCDNFSIGVFCFPAGATIPLHDHPEMVVLSKVLYSSLKARAYDWVVPPNPNFRRSGLARLVLDDKILGPSSPASVLFPFSGGNMHTFTALAPSAILDVLSPPYSDEEGRPTYFSEIAIPKLSGFAILEEKEVRVPEDLMVIGAKYIGPDLILNDEDGDDEEEEEDELY